MPKFESSRPPEITAHELPNITHLLTVFDRITFNTYGELVAELKIDLPVVGAVVVSLYDRENHIKIYRDGDDSLAGIWSGYLYDMIHDWEHGNLERENLIAHVKTKVREAVATLV